MEFADLLKQEGIPLNDVALCLHKGRSPHDLRVLQSMAENARHLFDAYQSTHPKVPEATFRKRPLVASFLASASGEQTFIGLYERSIGTPLTPESIRASSDFMEMLRKMHGPAELERIISKRVGRIRFGLTLRPELGWASRRLVVRDPGARAYVRLPEKTPLPLIEIKRTARITPPLPQWDELLLEADDIRNLPSDWETTLSHWRGIYMILDRSDGARYVGAAYGADNLLGRWRTHVSGEHGVTVKLKRRRPSDFVFSILELLAPTAGIEDVTAREQTWIARLQTRKWGLNA